MVSCVSAGNCGAGGPYSTGSAGQAFVVDERNGIWGSAQRVPGLAALSTGGAAGLNSVSCAGAGNCAAGGGYQDRSSHTHVHVVSETTANRGMRGTPSAPRPSPRGRVES